MCNVADGSSSDLEKEEVFVKRCMDNLVDASSQVQKVTPKLNLYM